MRVISRMDGGCQSAMLTRMIGTRVRAGCVRQPGRIIGDRYRTGECVRRWLFIVSERHPDQPATGTQNHGGIARTCQYGERKRDLRGNQADGQQQAQGCQPRTPSSHPLQLARHRSEYINGQRTTICAGSRQPLGGTGFAVAGKSSGRCRSDEIQVIE